MSSQAALRRRFLLIGSLAVLAAALVVGASSARTQDGWIGELAVDNTIQKDGVTYRSRHVRVVSATCTGVKAKGFRVHEITIQFHRFQCVLEGADGQTYATNVRITSSTATRFSWQVTSIKKTAAPAGSSAPTLTGSAATSGGSWVYFVTGYRFSCPAAPAQFTAASYNPIVQGPAPLVGSAADQMKAGLGQLIIDQGSDQMTIGCTYFAPSGLSVIMYAAFALPNVNTNPYATFDFGCGQNMNYPGGPSGYRSYYIASPNRWAYATFTDYYHAVQPQQLPVMAEVARTLLHNVGGAAATCSLDTTIPIAVGAAWTWSFDVRVSNPDLTILGSGKGAFTSYAAPDASGDVKIRNFYTSYPGATLTVTRNGVSHTLSLSVSKPIFYYHQTDFALSVKLTVTASTDPSCPTGSTGTYAIAGSYSYGMAGPPPPGKPIAFSLCGYSAKGKQQVRGGIRSGAEGG